MTNRKLNFLVLLLPLLTFSQLVELDGSVYGNSDIEGIHIINTTSNRFTTTNQSGKFIITAKANDTILVSAIRYKKETIIITSKHITNRKLQIYLIEKVTALDKVLVGKVLTGALDSDINNQGKGRPLDFYDVGIPGYVGKPKTQVERRYFDANNGKYFNGLSFNFYKFINKVSGRTKRLKEYMRLEHNNKLIYDIKDRLSNQFFAEHPLKSELRNDFLFFCSDDPLFEMRCMQKSDIEILDYMSEKYKEYLNNSIGGKED